jgi:hypothetical protein
MSTARSKAPVRSSSATARLGSLGLGVGGVETGVDADGREHGGIGPGELLERRRCRRRYRRSVRPWKPQGVPRDQRVLPAGHEGVVDGFLHPVGGGAVEGAEVGVGPADERVACPRCGCQEEDQHRDRRGRARQPSRHQALHRVADAPDDPHDPRPMETSNASRSSDSTTMARALPRLMWGMPITSRWSFCEATHWTAPITTTSTERPARTRQAIRRDRSERGRSARCRPRCTRRWSPRPTRYPIEAHTAATAACTVQARGRSVGESASHQKQRAPRAAPYRTRRSGPNRRMAGS